ncbi:DDE-type integrase/transposase/recombinase [Bacillus thuringiensis]|uniref:DDE-type integrase/transposase/recombinase n=1 Tax=Bacillus thuringiensis TaxID=1428 RepID=UPI0012FD1861
MIVNRVFTYVRTNHVTIKHLHNLIEQNHLHVKCRFAKSSGFRSICNNLHMIKGIETIQSLYKQGRNLESDSVFSVYSGTTTVSDY